MTLGEINEGIASLLRSGAERRAVSLGKWLDDVIDRYDYRIISIGIGIALTAGSLADFATAKGAHPGLADVFIAATAKMRYFTLVTRNLRHFSPTRFPELAVYSQTP